MKKWRILSFLYEKGNKILRYQLYTTVMVCVII